MNIITQNNKKQVEIKPANWADMCELKQQAFKCLKLEELNLDLDKIQNPAKLVDTILQLVINIETSEDFNRALFRCLKYCIYDEFYSITEQLLSDKPEIIEDYYEIVSNCIEVNLRPFFKSLVTEFKRRTAALKQDSPEQK